MEYKRTFLYAALFAVAYALWMAWLNEHPTLKVQSNGQEHSAIVSEGYKQPYIPVTETKKKTATEHKKPSSSRVLDNQRLVTVHTDVLSLKIDLTHGDVVDVRLLKYDQSAKEQDKPFHLLYSGDSNYVANNSLFVRTDEGVNNVNFDYQVTQKQFTLTPHKDSLVVTLKGQANDLEVLKTFTFKRGSYLVHVDYELRNMGQSAWKGQMNSQFVRSAPQNAGGGLFHVSSYTGAAYSDPSVSLYHKFSFPNMVKSDLSKNVKDGWIAMQQHYFLTAWVPPSGSDNHFYSRVVNGEYMIGYVSNPIIVQPNATKNITNRLYLGPELTKVLQHIAPGLDLTIDYGWLWFISKYLFLLMSFIHSVVGNWGWSIVLVTILIKLLFFQLSAKSYRSMASMRNLQPKIEALRKRYADDKAKLSQATMELYRAEKVNPFGGCLPIIVQIPVFIALYWVLLESVQLRQAPWILWIHDLSEADPFYILPIIMGLTMLLQQKMSPASPDPDQAKMMMFLPVVFTFLFASFPAGLVLYWTVNNSLSILQQWYITRKYSGEKKNKKIMLKKAAV